MVIKLGKGYFQHNHELVKMKMKAKQIGIYKIYKLSV